MLEISKVIFTNRTAALLVGRGISLETKEVCTLMQKDNYFRVSLFSEVEEMKKEGWAYSCNV